MSKLPRIAVLLPTIDGREDHLDRCANAYLRTADADLELIVVRNEPTCGWGWQAAAGKMSAACDYVHFTCDDLEPMPGWHRPAIEALAAHKLPAPYIHNARTHLPESFPQWGVEPQPDEFAGMSCVPFLSRELWEDYVSPMLCSHYFTDNWISWRAGRAGYEARVTPGYSFRHHWAQTGRGAGMGYEDRLRHDQAVFLEAVRMTEAGEWAGPWPSREDSRPKA